MRLFTFIFAGFCLFASPGLRAASITPEEAKLQVEFNKAYNNPDKEARKTAMAMLDGAKHPSTWQLLYARTTADPEAEVRLAGFTVLAKEPARDPSLARMLVQAFSAIKNDDEEGKLNYAKAMAASPFKADIAFAIGDRLTKLRYPDVPRYQPGSSGGGASSSNNAKQIENIKRIRKDYEDLLEAFNAIAQSEVAGATKESPNLIKNWLGANQAKLAQADRELAEKYKKEDEEAAKAAKAANAANAAK